MTDVADPYRRDDDDVSIIPDVDDVTQLDDRDREGTALGDSVPRDEDADLYTQTVKAPGVESGEGTSRGHDGDLYTQTVEASGVDNGEGASLGDENTPVTPQDEERAGGNLEHGLGNPGGSTHDGNVEEGTEFGLGADNTQDTPPVHEADLADPLRHGLGQADVDTVE